MSWMNRPHCTRSATLDEKQCRWHIQSNKSWESLCFGGCHILLPSSMTDFVSYERFTQKTFHLGGVLIIVLVSKAVNTLTGSVCARILPAAERQCSLSCPSYHSVSQLNTTEIQIQNRNEELNSGLPRTNPASDGMEVLIAKNKVHPK